MEGARTEGRESTGHTSGRRIVDILRKKNDELTDTDLAHMRKGIGYVHRHLARPAGDVSETPWRYSLMSASGTSAGSSSTGGDDAVPSPR